MTALAIDLFCGLGGWTDGLLAEGYEVVGFDIERHEYGGDRYPAQLVIQDVLTLHGSQFRDAALIVASPPCQEYSYMAMPWTKAKALAADYRSGIRDVKQLTALFDACFRLQSEACQAAGRHVPLVVENVRGAIPWVGRSRWNFGSFHLWGDVPALMPIVSPRAVLKEGVTRRSNGATNFHGFKSSGMNWSDPTKRGQDFTRLAGRQAMCIDGVKQAGIGGLSANGLGDAWFQDGAARYGSKSSSRKAASAMIAKIPLPLSRHIAATYYPAAMRAGRGGAA